MAWLLLGCSLVKLQEIMKTKASLMKTWRAASFHTIPSPTSKDLFCLFRNLRFVLRVWTSCRCECVFQVAYGCPWWLLVLNGCVQKSSTGCTACSFSIVSLLRGHQSPAIVEISTQVLHVWCIYLHLGHTVDMPDMEYLGSSEGSKCFVSSIPIMSSNSRVEPSAPGVCLPLSHRYCERFSIIIICIDQANAAFHQCHD